MNIINGFKIIGPIWLNNKNCYKCNALCKVCKKEFETNYHSLQRMKSCGCARPKQLKALPEYINGFRTIRCHGYDKERGVRWATVECKECKKEYEVDPNKLQYRKHCGCLKKGAVASRYNKSHPQLSQTIKYMRSRCYDKNSQDYYNYGARGITICDEWLKDRNIFCEWSLANGYENNKRLSIDRIDSSKGYSPENCRWVNATIQSRNTRRNKLTLEQAREIRNKLSFETVQKLAKEYMVSIATIWAIKSNHIWNEVT